MLEFLGKHKPDYVVCAFDESLQQGIRNDIYPSYKSSRERPDETVVFQLELCKQLARELGVCVLVSQRYEADDLLANASKIAHKNSLPISVISRDKDLIQIVENEYDTWWPYPTEEPLHTNALTERWGVRPDQIADLLALAGDSSDDIPGVPGVGKKTAAKLLDKFDNLENIFTNLSSVANSDIRGSQKLAEKLAEYHDQVNIAKKLSRLYSELNAIHTLEELMWYGPKISADNFLLTNGLERYSRWLTRLRQVL